MRIPNHALKGTPVEQLRKNRSRTERLTHWNRRAWQEITILRVRVNTIEEKLGIDAGGAHEYSPDGDPWEVETVRDPFFALWAFIGGMVFGAIIMGVVMWG